MDGAELPLTYSPEAIDEFWGRRPVAVASRALQLLGIGGMFFAKFGWDFFTGRLAETEVGCLGARNKCSMRAHSWAGKYIYMSSSKAAQCISSHWWCVRCRCSAPSSCAIL